VDDVTTVNIGKISGGKQTNIVPDECIVLGEIRSLKDDQAIKELNKLREIFEQTAASYEGSIEFLYEKQIEAYEISEEEEVVRRFRKASEGLGFNTVTQYTLGGSDNNHFVHNGIRGIVVACGMNEVHTTKEYTTVDQLEKSASLALSLITS
jgi:tripeptide aminopeptidase